MVVIIIYVYYGLFLLIYQGIREGSLVGQIDGICVGDHIEKVNDISVIGNRHFEVAKVLKEIQLGDQFSLRLIEPIKSGFSEFSLISVLSLDL